MGYCKQCGAYIPDGQTQCLACGFDEAAKPNSGTASASATATAKAQRSAEETERLRRQMEEQRARQQEKSRQWAEQEAARRKAQEEARQTQYKARQNAHIPYSPEGDRSAFNEGTESSVPGADFASVAKSKTFAFLSYLGVLCFVPLFVCKNDDFVMFHAKQGLTLLILWAIASFLGLFANIGWLASVAYVYFVIKGIINVNNGKKEPLPLIGNILKF